VERLQIQNVEQVVNLLHSHLNTHLETSYYGHEIPVMHRFWHVNPTNVARITYYNINSINHKWNEAKKLKLKVKIIVAI
jgi:hypothetical protein